MAVTDTVIEFGEFKDESFDGEDKSCDNGGGTIFVAVAYTVIDSDGDFKDESFDWEDKSCDDGGEGKGDVGGVGGCFSSFGLL